MQQFIDLLDDYALATEVLRNARITEAQEFLLAKAGVAKPTDGMAARMTTVKTADHVTTAEAKVQILRWKIDYFVRTGEMPKEERPN